MEWQVAIILLFAVTIILFPVIFIWYLNVGGIYAALRGKMTNRVKETAGRVTRIALAVIMPLSIYAVIIWFFQSHFGWQVALAIALALPVVLFIPVLIWAAVISGLYQVVLELLRRRTRVQRRRIVKRLGVPAIHRAA
jgi:hypothetical protein